jgi:hypothetical protein
MNNMKWLIALFLIVAVLFCVGYLTRYDYFKIGRGDGVEMEFRTNRYTNETDALDNHGWHVVQTGKEWSDLHWSKTHPIEPLPAPVEVK